LASQCCGSELCSHGPRDRVAKRIGQLCACLIVCLCRADGILSRRWKRPCLVPSSSIRREEPPARALSRRCRRRQPHSYSLLIVHVRSRQLCRYRQCPANWFKFDHCIWCPHANALCLFCSPFTTSSHRQCSSLPCCCSWCYCRCCPRLHRYACFVGARLIQSGRFSNIRYLGTSILSGWRFWSETFFYDATLSFFGGRFLHYTLSFWWISADTTVMSIAM
jgi:hypothetical protein